MREEIKNNLDNPRQLEKLYRDNKIIFRREFNLIYPEIRENVSARIWNERLNFENDEFSRESRSELVFVIVASLIAGLIAKIPDIISVEYEFFYPRNFAFAVFPLLTAYFAWKQNIQTPKLIIISAVILVSVFYINLLPNDPGSDTLILACIHLPLFLWIALGFTFVGDEPNNYKKRLEFLRYNGDLLVMTTIILIAGSLLTAATIGLFNLIEAGIEEFYFQYIGIIGLAASPIVGTYLVHTNPQLVNKISPVIARIFTPLVLLTLVIYLLAIVFTAKDPYSDRDFLLIFNMLLIGVMALIFFSVAEAPESSGGKMGMLLLFGLSFVTVMVNLIALSAILFRISEWGITPNRLAVLGSNILILINLLIVAYRLLKTLKDRSEIEGVQKSIVSFLPFYGIWIMLVTFTFPVLFNFK